MMTRHRYPVDSCRLLLRTSAEKLQLAMQLSESEQEVENPKDEKDDGRGKKGDGKGTLKALLGGVLGYGPTLTEHIILGGGLQPTMKTSVLQQKGLEEEQFSLLLSSIRRFEDWLDNVVRGVIVPEGYIYMKNRDRAKKKHSSAAPENDDESVKVSRFSVHAFCSFVSLFDFHWQLLGYVQLYEEFCPIPLEQLAGRENWKLETFDAAMDEFFSKIEGQRSEQQRRSQEDSAMSKLDKIRADQVELFRSKGPPFFSELYLPCRFC